MENDQMKRTFHQGIKLEPLEVHVNPPFTTPVSEKRKNLIVDEMDQRRLRIIKN